MTAVGVIVDGDMVRRSKIVNLTSAGNLSSVAAPLREADWKLDLTPVDRAFALALTFTATDGQTFAIRCDRNELARLATSITALLNADRSTIDAWLSNAVALLGAAP